MPASSWWDKSTGFALLTILLWASLAALTSRITSVSPLVLVGLVLLAPFLLLLSAWMRAKSGEGAKSKLVIPWFAMLFLLVGAFNSLHLLPKATVDAILLLDVFLLATAMAAPSPNCPPGMARWKLSVAIRCVAFTGPPRVST